MVRYTGMFSAHQIKGWKRGREKRERWTSIVKRWTRSEEGGVCSGTRRAKKQTKRKTPQSPATNPDEAVHATSWIGKRGGTKQGERHKKATEGG